MGLARICRVVIETGVGECQWRGRTGEMKARFSWLKFHRLEVGIWSMIVKWVLKIHHILEIHRSLEVRRFKSFWLVVGFVLIRVKKGDFLSFLFGLICKIFFLLWDFSYLLGLFWRKT